MFTNVSEAPARFIVNIKAAGSSETLAILYQTARYNISPDSSFKYRYGTLMTNSVALVR
jgi:hypothetical protein